MLEAMFEIEVVFAVTDDVVVDFDFEDVDDGDDVVARKGKGSQFHNALHNVSKVWNLCVLYLFPAHLVFQKL